MKTKFLFLTFTFVANLTFAQEKWFTPFTDSVALVNSANKIASVFIKDIKRIEPGIEFDVSAIVNTTRSLVFYHENTKTVNLPFWEQLVPEQRKFFYEVAGDEAAGKIAFGLFFNGFYLPHELGHAFQHLALDGISPTYDSEYFANTVAMLWWRKQNRQEELKLCYEYAKKMWSQLPNPAPNEMSVQEFFKDFRGRSLSPYSYGYMQFYQFIQIYEDTSLTDFDTFIQQALPIKH